MFMKPDFEDFLYSLIKGEIKEIENINPIEYTNPILKGLTNNESIMEKPRIENMLNYTFH